MEFLENIPPLWKYTPPSISRSEIGSQPDLAEGDIFPGLGTFLDLRNVDSPLETIIWGTPNRKNFRLRRAETINYRNTVENAPKARKFWILSILNDDLQGEMARRRRKILRFWTSQMVISKGKSAFLGSKKGPDLGIYPPFYLSSDVRKGGIFSRNSTDNKSEFSS